MLISLLDLGPSLLGSVSRMIRSTLDLEIREEPFTIDFAQIGSN